MAGEPGRLDLRRERLRAAQGSGRPPTLLEELSEAGRGEGATGAIVYELGLAVATSGEAGSDREAIELLERAARLLPEASNLSCRIGLLCLEQERFELAAPYEACLQLGHIYRRRPLDAQGASVAAEQLELAQRCYRLALDVRPQDPLVQRHLASLEGSD